MASPISKDITHSITNPGNYTHQYGVQDTSKGECYKDTRSKYWYWSASQ